MCFIQNIKFKFTQIKTKWEAQDQYIMFFIALYTICYSLGLIYQSFKCSDDIFSFDFCAILYFAEIFYTLQWVQCTINFIDIKLVCTSC